MSNNKLQNNKGFTLLEMIVSMGIFTIVAVIAVGSLVRISSLNRQAQSLQAATNNINYILESMSREMRVGSTYHCANGAVYNGNRLDLAFRECDNNSGDKGILFTSSNLDINGCNLVYGYWIKQDPPGNGNWSISKSQQNKCDDPIRMSDSLPLVDNNNVTITGIQFDNQPGSNGYSRFSIQLTGYAGKKENEKVNFSVRTMISQRIKD